MERTTQQDIEARRQNGVLNEEQYQKLLNLCVVVTARIDQLKHKQVNRIDQLKHKRVKMWLCDVGSRVGIRLYHLGLRQILEALHTRCLGD